MKKTVAKQEILVGCAALILLTLTDRMFIHIIMFAIMLLTILVYKTLNIAIENIVARITPEISELYKNPRI